MFVGGVPQEVVPAQGNERTAWGLCIHTNAVGNAFSLLKRGVTVPLKPAELG